MTTQCIFNEGSSCVAFVCHYQNQPTHWNQRVNCNRLVFKKPVSSLNPLYRFGLALPSEVRRVVQSCRRLNPEVETYRTEYNLFWSPQRRSHKGINFMPWLLTHQSFKALSSFPTPAALWLLRYETDCCWVFLCSDVTFQGCSQIFKCFFC